MDFYVTQVKDASGNSPFYDTLLTGARWAFGGKSYRVVYMRDVEEYAVNQDEISHVIKLGRAHLVVEIAKRIIGIILLLLIIPTVVGLILKSQDQKAQKNYIWLQSSLKEKPTLIQENLSKAPPLLPISEWHTSPLARDQQVVLSRLMNLWPRNSNMPRQVRENIRQICATVWGGTFAGHLRNSDHATTFIKNSLCDICNRLEQSSRTDDEKEQILRELSEVASKCNPTWVEVVGKLVRRVLSSSNQEEEEDRFLGFVQACKEEMALEGVQKRNPTQWHGLNNVRRQIGQEFGLELSFEHHDRYADHQSGPSSSSLRKDMFCELHPLRLIQGVTNAIRSETKARGKDSFVEGMDGLFQKAAYRFREASSNEALLELDFEDVDDLLKFYKGHFYQVKGRKSNGFDALELKETAVLWIMVVLGIVEAPPNRNKSSISEIYRDEIDEELLTVVT